jgi:hypothetical protein
MKKVLLLIIGGFLLVGVIGAPPAFAATPTVDSFTPDSGMVGDGVTTTGSSLTDASDVSFNGVSATSFSVDTDGQITATVPDGATTGPITVTTVDGTAMSGTDFTVLTSTPPPAIASFSPHHGAAGALVTITGSDLDQVTSLKFNGTVATFAQSSTQIATHVPSGATTGLITVTSTGGSDSTSANFEVVRRPVISGFSPQTGPVGTLVTLRGSHLRWTKGVWFGQRPARFVAVSDLRLRAKVPMGFKDAKIRVRNAAGQDTTSLSFHQRRIRVGTAVTFGLHAHLHAGGVVKSRIHACEANRLVLIQKLVTGSWHPIKKVHTGSLGAYDVAIADQTGTYRAVTVNRKTVRLDCLPDISPTAKHEHATSGGGGGGGGSVTCTPGYSPCLTYHGGADYDCAGGSGNGPYYTKPGDTYRVTGSDPYGLDADNDGYGCE